MKLCPQCDFIYEDDQCFCDMDGKALVHDPAPVDTKANVASPSSPTPRLPGRRSRSVALAVAVGVVLTVLLIAVYFVRNYKSRSHAASESTTQSPGRSAGQSSVQPAAEDADAQSSASDLVATQTPAANSALAERSPVQSVEQFPEQSTSQTDATLVSSRASLSHARLAANPVATKGASGSGRGPVIVRLNNGATIKADEAWEKKEGLWYRQAGVVTFLKRSRVKTIERVASPRAQSNSAGSNAEEKSRKQNTTTPNQLRLARLEPVEIKKQSRVTSFLKKTGRILKKPFKI